MSIRGGVQSAPKKKDGIQISSMTGAKKKKEEEKFPMQACGIVSSVITPPTDHCVVFDTAATSSSSFSKSAVFFLTLCELRRHDGNRPHTFG